MNVKTMRLRPLKLGKCSIEVTSSNDKKPKVRVENDKLVVEPFCRCGASCGEFHIDDHTSKIIESALIEKEIAEKRGKPLKVQMDDFSSIDLACGECGREIHISVHHVLDESWLKQLNKKRLFAKESMLYGDVLRIECEVKGGHFAETRSPRVLSELLNPICACGSQITPIPLRTATQTMIDEINRFWDEGGEVKPKKVEITEKCRFCLHDVKISAKLEPLLPDKNASVQDAVKKFKAWKKRKET